VETKEEDVQIEPQTEFSIPFVNGGKKFEVPLITVSDVRAMQKKRAAVTDANEKELEASVTLAYQVLRRIDGSIVEEDIINWEYSDFLNFIQGLWAKNAANFRGTLPTLAQQMAAAAAQKQTQK